MTILDPRAAQAYQLYIVDGLSLRAVRDIVRADRSRVRRWIVELGGTIRPHRSRGVSATPRAKTSPNPVCSIGHYEHNNRAALGGGWYCSRYCEHDDRCTQEATVADLAAFERLGKVRKADAKLIKERKKKKLSGNALWWGVRGKWR